MKQQEQTEENIIIHLTIDEHIVLYEALTFALEQKQFNHGYTEIIENIQKKIEVKK